MFGRGLGTFDPITYFFVDNQILITLVTGGIVGLFGLLVLIGTGATVARQVFWHGRDEETRHLGAALAASIVGGFCGFYTFDAFAFPVFAGYTFLILGLSRRALAARGRSSRTSLYEPATAGVGRGLMQRSSTAVRDVVLVLSQESVGDMVRRGFHRPPDRALADAGERSPRRSAARHELLSQLPRAVGASASSDATTRPWSLDADVRLLQPRRIRRSDPRTVAGAERTFLRFDHLIERACAAEGLHDPAIVTFHPLVAGFADL